MRHLVFNKILNSLLLIILLFSLSTNRAFAATDCSNIADPEPGNPTAQLTKIVCPIYGAINIMVFISGAAFVGLIIFGTLKFTLSQGDQKAIEGGKMTLTWGVIGFIVVIGAWAGLNIIFNVFGVTNPLDDFESSIQQILDWAAGS